MPGGRWRAWPHRLEARVPGEGRFGLLGLGQPQGGGGHDRDAQGAQQGLQLTDLAEIVGGQHDLPAAAPLTPPPRARGLLVPDQPGDTACGQFLERQELGAGDRHVLGGELDLDDVARGGEHEVGVGQGRAVLLVVEVERTSPLDQAARHRGHGLAQGRRGRPPGRHQLEQSLMQGDVGRR